MSVVATPPVESQEQRIILDNVNWETYEGLLAANRDRSSPRMAYDKGTLEIMTPSLKHEDLKQILATAAELAAEEWGIEFRNLGSTTYRRQEPRQGAEPDSCLYVQNVERIRGKEEINLAVDPPPDLVIEIEITSPVLNRLPIYAGFGVPEIWITDGHSVRILRLSQELHLTDRYLTQEKSEVLPPLDAAVLTRFVEQSTALTMLAWRRTVREWARQHRP